MAHRPPKGFKRVVGRPPFSDPALRTVNKSDFGTDETSAEEKAREDGGSCCILHIYIYIYIHTHTHTYDHIIVCYTIV